MRKLSSLLLFWVTLLALFVSITGFLANVNLTGRIFQILFVPVTLYLIFTSISHLLTNVPALDRRYGAKRLLIYYCFIVTLTLFALSFFSSRTLADIVSSIFFSPLAVYFLLLVLPRVSVTPEVLTIPKGGAKEEDLKDLFTTSAKIDVSRRDFLKLLGTVGISAFILSLFAKRGLPLFESGTVADTVSLKDNSGNKIEPAEKSPTDGYYITELDDSAPTSYFGFINKKGQWFIMREGKDGGFRYVKGSSGFNNSWENRNNLIYEYFDNVF